MTTLKVGDQAPDFELMTDQGEPRRLQDLRGKRVVLFFYPKADTPGCTVEACGFRDDYSSFTGIDVEILGISPDSVRSQLKFRNKFDLQYNLLADSEHQVAERYGVWGWKKFMGREYEGVSRTTFIIDEEGKISHVFEKVKPEGHADEVLKALESN